MSDISCTCSDLTCPNHPINHNEGCTPCIRKNLEKREIPACFFKKVDPDKKRSSFYFEDFAKEVLTSIGNGESIK